MKNKRIATLLPFIALLVLSATAQSTLPDSCKLRFGTNLGGLADYGTELPFVDLMHNCRTWYTKDVNNPNGGPFNTEQANQLTYRPDGYPTHLPQTVAGQTYQQTVATIWAITDGWTPGKYTVLYDGTGTLQFWGSYSNLIQSNPNRITFDFNTPVGGILELKILTSDIADPIRNIRVLLPGTESTYQTQPFNPIWLEKLKIFNSVRFMDWGQTNSWGQPDQWNWADTTLFDWADRQHLDHYTWANNKGIPYEMMIKLLNDYHLDGWVCVPHRASNDYMQQMAQLFHDQLETDRHLTVEYSNEIWNWIFGQAQWLNQFGCVDKGIPWPEGTVPYIQNCLNIWTTEYGNDLKRITRTVGVQTAWQDVSNRTVFNLTPGSFDAFSPAFYFGLSEEADQVLDQLGSNATAKDIAYWARKGREVQEKKWILTQKETIADSLHIPMFFYEGGQHLTPTPFGEEPTYAQALLDIQRDTAIYNLYDEWFDFLRTLQSGDRPLELVNFSFVGLRSARYGSWGILETMDQDLTVTPAPKYRALLDNLANCTTIVPIKETRTIPLISFSPNPTCNWVTVRLVAGTVSNVTLSDFSGRILTTQAVQEQEIVELELRNRPSGTYLLTITARDGSRSTYKIIKQ